MVTAKQRKSNLRNLAKGRAKWKKMSKRSRAKAMPGGKGKISKR